MTRETDDSKRFEGYSDYQSVSQRVAQSVDDAIEAYAWLDSLHNEDARIQNRDAADARASIHAAALRLLPELEANATTGSEDDEHEDEDEFTRMHDAWTGQEGYLTRLNDTQLHKSNPEWLGSFVADIRRAAWEIGYLKAGRTVQDSNLEPADEQAKDMFIDQ